MRSRLLPWFFLPCLSGCLVDLYGGDPRLQVMDASHRWNLVTVGLGDTARPDWTRGFDPPISNGKLSEVMDLPVAGNLNAYMELRDTSGTDTFVSFALSAEIGQFRKLSLEDDSAGRLRIR